MRRVVPILIGLALSLTACAERRDERVVVIDPGHGGVDPGAIGRTGNLLEKEVALRTGLALRDQLEATGRYRVIMTRDGDRFVELRDRLLIAREGQGELFISLHADSLVSAPEVSGASVYAPSERPFQNDPAGVAEKDFPDILAKTDSSSQEDLVPKVLIDLAQRHINNQSITLAESLVQELNGATRMAKRQPAQADFVVLNSHYMPSVLVELGFLSNAADEMALADDTHIAALAAAIARAVDAYFGVGSV